MKNKAEDNKFSKFIPDYEYWFNKKDITEDEACLVIQGVNPDIYEGIKNPKVLGKEISQIDLNKELSEYIDITKLQDISNMPCTDGNKIFYKSFVDRTEFIKKENIWRKDMYNLCLSLYERAYALPNSLLDFLESKNKKPTHFNHYKRTNQYVIDDYKKFLQESPSAEDYIYIIYGLEPNFAKKYFGILEKYKNIEFYKDWENEDRFFYHYYDCYFKWSDNCPAKIPSKEDIEFINQQKFKGGWDSFIKNLYNEGFIFSDKLTNYLTNANIKLEYKRDSWVYNLFDFYSEKEEWALNQIYCLLLGINPDKKSQKMRFLNSQRKNSQYLYEINLNLGHEECSDRFFRPKKIQEYKIIGKTFEQHIALDEYLSDLKKEDKYQAKKVLERIIKHTKIKPPQILKDLVLDEKKLVNTNCDINLSYTHGQKKAGVSQKIDFNKIFENLYQILDIDASLFIKQGNEGKELYKNSQCLSIATAFNELKTSGKHNQKFYINERTKKLCGSRIINRLEKNDIKIASQKNGGDINQTEIEGIIKEINKFIK